MSIEGKWRVRYVLQQEPPFLNEEGGDEQIGSIIIQDGKVKGNDPWGGEYNDTYTLIDGMLNAVVKVTAYENDAESIFDGQAYPFNLELNGVYNGTDHFSMKGQVTDNPNNKIVLNLTRIDD